MVFFGSVWVLQGFNVLPGSFMSGQSGGRCAASLGSDSGYRPVAASKPETAARGLIPHVHVVCTSNAPRRPHSRPPGRMIDTSYMLLFYTAVRLLSRTTRVALVTLGVYRMLVIDFRAGRIGSVHRLGQRLQTHPTQP